MPYVQIHVDAEDVLEELSDDDLRGEIARRAKRRPGKGEDGIEAWAPRGLAADLRLTFYSRNASHFEALLRVLEDRELQPPRRIQSGPRNSSGAPSVVTE